METIKFTSNFKIHISDTVDSDTLDAKFIICDFEPNRNDVALTRDTIESWLTTLITKPVVGKIIATQNGNDFSGHNVKIVEKKDENGNTYQEIEFDTSAFGSFYSASIEEIDGKEHIVANAKIWKRFSQAYDVISRRMSSEEGIKTSWEVQVIESHYEDLNGKQIKYIDNGVFIGHALLGETVAPAYPSSGLINIASKGNTDIENELVNALITDIAFSTKEEEELKKTQVASLTTRDLHQKVYEALNPKGWNSNPYYSIWEIYPEEHKILAYDIDRDSEDDYLVVTYTVSEDVVSVGEKTETKLSKLISEKTNVNISVNLDDTAKLLSEKELTNKNLVSENKKLTSELDVKTSALVEASDKIVKLETEISELAPFKLQIEEAEKAQKEVEMAQKKEDLKVLATAGDFITKEEIETSEEISKLINELDEKGIKAIIAERFIQKLSQGNENSEKKDTEIEVSVTKKNINTDENIYESAQIMSHFLHNK
ncbi:hypothetical protein [Paenibacillus polymyxa]|uniref:hypothetical protein n=1 Tax=Paenibacillus polymyxa TaxID=1406 RepID=UPI002AB38D06|nr:hypothetical protein [Paenibacillus polymyxa]MDY8021254.1 hypothetical protein [Paenibacillus polymyxa]